MSSIREWKANEEDFNSFERKDLLLKSIQFTGPITFPAYEDIEENIEIKKSTVSDETFNTLEQLFKRYLECRKLKTLIMDINLGKELSVNKLGISIKLDPEFFGNINNTYKENLQKKLDNLKELIKLEILKA